MGRQCHPFWMATVAVVDAAAAAAQSVPITGIQLEETAGQLGLRLLTPVETDIEGIINRSGKQLSLTFLMLNFSFKQSPSSSATPF